MTSTIHDETARIKDLFKRECEAMLEFLLALVRLDQRRGWADLGHSGLFPYLRAEIGLPKSTAFYRTCAARLIQTFPRLVDPMREGKLCLSVLPDLRKVVTEENFDEVVPKFFGCSRDDASKLVVAMSPPSMPPKRDVIKVVAQIAQLPTAPQRREPEAGSPVLRILHISES
jgi:hypothetical protein